jgi:hypothetical protein
MLGNAGWLASWAHARLTDYEHGDPTTTCSIVGATAHHNKHASQLRLCQLMETYTYVWQYCPYCHIVHINIEY